MSGARGMVSQPTLSIEEASPRIEAPYLDSSVCLAHIKGERLLAHGGLSRIQVTTAILEAARQGQFKIWTSFFTLAEVRRIRGSTSTPSLAELRDVNQLFAEFLQHQWIEPLELGRSVGEKAQELGAIHSLSAADSVHLASAVLSGAK